MCSKSHQRRWNTRRSRTHCIQVCIARSTAIHREVDAASSNGSGTCHHRCTDGQIVAQDAGNAVFRAGLDPANQISRSPGSRDSSRWDAKFGNFSRRAPVIITEWISGAHFCDAERRNPPCNSFSTRRNMGLVLIANPSERRHLNIGFLPMHNDVERN
jgi:hypothetical protein